MSRWSPVALAVLTAISAISCAETEAPGPSGGDSLATVRVTHGMRVVQSRLDRAVWVLEADEAVHDPERDVTDLAELTVTFHGREGEVSSVLTADTGEADAKTRHLVARENVVVNTPEGYRLETETLRWDNERERILSDDPVRIRQGRNVYTGVGLVSDPELTEFEILKDFRAIVLPEDGENPSAADDPSR